jgi:tocopherol O-methyltransferase
MLEPSEREAIAAYYLEMDSSFAHWGSPPAYEMHYGYKESPSADHFESLARMNAVVAELAGIGPHDAVLDAGCGVGASALWLAMHAGARVHGISLSPLQVAKAEQVAAQRGLAERPRFSVQDYTATAFPDRSFDVVWAMESLCHAPRKDEFLREAHRLLRPGGRIVVADYVLARSSLGRVELAVLRAWADGWVMAMPPTQHRFAEMLARAGFSEPHWYDLTDAIRCDAHEMYRRGHAGLEEDRRSATQRRIAHVEACMAQKVALDRALWRYVVVVGAK